MHHALVPSAVFSTVLTLAIISGSTGDPGDLSALALSDDGSNFLSRAQSLIPEDIEANKRGWKDLQSSGWGKRGWKDLRTGGWGKRIPAEVSPLDRGNLRDLQGTMDKRGWGDLGGSWGKRDVSRLQGLWGSRRDNLRANGISADSNINHKDGYDDYQDRFQDNGRQWDNIKRDWGSFKDQRAFEIAILGVNPQTMAEEIPIWVNGIIQWISGVDKKTTCRDVIEALLVGEGNNKHCAQDYTIMERWRRVERPLDENSKILKIWSHWGDEKKEVRLCLKRINNEIDSGRGSPVGIGSTPSLKRRRHHRSRVNGKPPWGHQETLHPKRLAELGGYYKEQYEEYQARKFWQADGFDNHSEREDDEPIYDSRHHCTYGDKAYGKRGDENWHGRKKSGNRSYHCTGTGILHSTLIASNEDDYGKPTTSKCCSKRQSKSKVRNSENIEKLMKLILAQGATIQSQLQKLKEREDQIESLENDRHRERIEKNGRNYLLETYLGSLKEAEIPVTEEERGNDSGIHTEGGSDQMNPGWEKNKMDRLQQATKCDNATPEHYGRRDDLSNGVHPEENKTSPSRSRRSRSEGRTGEGRWDRQDGNSLKRALSENTLAESGDVRVGDNRESNEPLEPEEASDVLELRRIQSQVEMWEKVFRINKKLEKEEENLVRLHIKIKRFQTENVKFARNAEETDPQQSKGIVDEDSKSVQQDLEALRKDLDQNSKEIYQNFTKLKEGEEVVQQKRTILNRLMDDLEKTEEEHCFLSKMALAAPDDRNEGRTSFGEGPDHQDDPSADIPEIVPIRLYSTVSGTKNPSKVGDDSTEAAHKEPPRPQPSACFNQRIEAFERSENSDAKPKNVKISFEDQVQHGQEKQRELPSCSPGTIKGILKNRNCNVERCANDSFQKCHEIKDRTMNDNAATAAVPKYVMSPAYRESSNFYNVSSLTGRTGADPKTLYSAKFESPSTAHRSESGPYPTGNIMNTKTSINNDTDSSTSSDTSGLCSMYSSSPTAEEHYAEPTYVLNTLV